jgi:hypothetical protein
METRESLRQRVSDNPRGGLRLRMNDETARIGGYRVSEIRALTTLRNRVAWVSSGHLRLVVGGQNQVVADANMMRLAY